MKRFPIQEGSIMTNFNAFKRVIFTTTVAIGCVSCATKRISFDDSGTNYNPMSYVQTIETGDGAYTIEFKNDIESYFTNFIVTSEGVVAFDPLSDSAATVYSEIIKNPVH